MKIKKLNKISMMGIALAILITGIVAAVSASAVSTTQAMITPNSEEMSIDTNGNLVYTAILIVTDPGGVGYTRIDVTLTDLSPETIKQGMSNAAIAAVSNNLGLTLTKANLVLPSFQNG